MSQPLIATGRLLWTYTYSGITHKLIAYVRNVQAVGGSWNINSRTTDANDLLWTLAAEALEQSVSYLLANSVAGGDVLLQTLAAGVWNTLATYSPVTSHAVGTTVPVAQSTMVLRDTNFKKVKVVVMEPNQAAPQHWVSPLGGDANMDNFTKQWMSTFTVSNAPYNWQVGRGNQYLSTSPFIGITVTLNKKLRRARGYT